MWRHNAQNGCDTARRHHDTTQEVRDMAEEAATRRATAHAATRRAAQYASLPVTRPLRAATRPRYGSAQAATRPTTQL